MQRYFLTTESTPTGELPLPADIAQHLMTVLRGNVGTPLEVVINGQLYLAHVSRQADKDAYIIVDEPLANASELPIGVTIACGLPKGDKTELITQKATELGATKIFFFEAERSVAHWASAKRARKLERLQKIANGAAEQSHRLVIPTVQYFASLSDLLAQTTATKRLVAWEESAKQGEAAQLTQTLSSLSAGNSLLTIFGPEGGLSEDEITLMTGSYVEPAGLGPRILRAETAPLYLLSAVSYHFELEN